MKRIAVMVGLFVLFIPSLASAVDCNGDGIDSAQAGFHSAVAGATCVAEMVGGNWNAVLPVVIAVMVPSVVIPLAYRAIRALISVNTL